MIRSAKLNKYGSHPCNNYHEVMEYFTDKFLHSDDPEEGYEFMELFSAYIDGSKFPCDKIVLNAFTGYSDVFGMEFKYRNESICYITVQVLPHDMFKVYNKTYYKHDFEILHHIIEDYFDDINKSVLERWMNLCKIDKSEDARNEVHITEYVDYKIKGETSFTGSISEIFDRYTTINDRLKYCNGHYFRFKDGNVSELYSIFTKCYKGNYFLNNAVKRGVIID